MMDPGLADYHLGDNDRGGVMSLSGFGIDQGVDDRSTFDMMDSFGPSQGLFDDADASYFDRSHMAMDLGAPEPEVSSLMPSMSSFRTASTSPVPNNKVRRAPAPTVVPAHPTHVTRGGKSAPKTRDGTGAQQWVDPETVMCEQCGSGDNAQELLICDGCNKGRHTYCLPFALTLEQVAEVPKWYCPACVLSRAKLKQKSNVYLRKYYISAQHKVKRDKSQPTLEQALAQGMLFIGEEDDEDEKSRKVLTASSEVGKKRVPVKKSDEPAANNKRKKSTRRGSESEESDDDEDEKPVRKRRALTSSNNGNNAAAPPQSKKSPGPVSVKQQVTGVTASSAPAPHGTQAASSQNIDAVFLSLVPLPNRMPLPQLHFRDKTLSELYDRVPSQTYECLDWHDFRIEFMPPQSSAHTPLSLTHVPQSQAAFNYPDWPVKAQPGPPRDMDIKPKKEMMPGPGMPPSGPYAAPPVKSQSGMTPHPINFPVTAGPPTSPFAPPSPYGPAPSYPFDQSKPPGPTPAPYPAPYPGGGYPKAPPMNPSGNPNYFPPSQSGPMSGPNSAPGPMMINPGPYPAQSHASAPDAHPYQPQNGGPMNYQSPPKPGPAPNQTAVRGPPSGAMPPSGGGNTAPGPYPPGTAPLPSRPSNMKWHNNVAPSPNPPPVPANAKNPARLIWNQAVPNPANYRPVGGPPMPPTAGSMPPTRPGPSQPYLTAPAQNVPKQIPMNPDQRPM